MKQTDSNFDVPAVPRRGDSVEIKGDYQHAAITRGNSVQRFWHYSKILAIETLLLPGPKDNVIDVGCGSGVISSFLAKTAASVLGIDANPDAIKFAEKTYSAGNLKFQTGLADQLIGQDGSVDKIYCLELVEHIYAEQTKAMLYHFNRFLKPGGEVFLTTPNYRSLWPVIEWLMDRLKLAPQLAVHQHVEKYTRKKLQNICMECGFLVQESRTMCFIAPWIAPLSRRLAKAVAKWELKWPFAGGAVLIFVLKKKG